MSKQSPTFTSAIAVPSAVVCLSLSPSASLWVGADDGTVRLYDLPSPRVTKAIKSLGNEISSVVSSYNADGSAGTIWVAAGRQAVEFHLNTHKLVLSAEDAISRIELGEDDEDVLNELRLSDNGKYIAFSTDAGTAGIVELSTQQISRMKTRHTSICATVRFIPGRPSEIVSGGYDSAILHFDFNQGSLLSRYDVSSAPPESGIALSPPFIQCSAMSPSGVYAAGTADGRIWLGGGGEKTPANRKKRSRKWEGLRTEEGLWIQAANGPVVAIAFSGATLLACTLLGTIIAFTMTRSEADRLQADQIWTAASKNVAKVNAMAVSAHWLVLGGYRKDSKGVIETWKLEEPLAGNAVSRPAE
ncbi:WD40 repeat-like protein [Obba rivulosa]|uniref:WD40 repeat-like protein n=1 Tax=Obba rivulosa TaxID=1052685 RepID=A0A8E2DPK6_9APHY|nr:WD40 repeat-like protein [Obba rivulosa]